MARLFFISTLCLIVVCGSLAQQPDYSQLRILVFGAHPDDCEIKAGGMGAKWAQQGHKVKFVSVTNGDIGHAEMAGGNWPGGARPK